MRVAGLALLLLMPGCIGLFDGPTTPVSSSQARDAFTTWIGESTTTSQREGWHTDPDTLERVDHRGNEVGWDSGMPMYVVSEPFLIDLEAFEGVADWRAVRKLLSSNDGGLVNPLYDDLQAAALHARFSPEDYDGTVDGISASWRGTVLVAWRRGAQDPWTVGFGYGDGPSWQGQSYSRGGDPLVCEDLASTAPAIDSADALAAALREPAFQAVRDAHPDGVLWMRLTLQERNEGAGATTCPTTAAPTWDLVWMDLAGLLEGEGPYILATLDAANGQVRRVHEAMLRDPDRYRATTLLEAAQTPNPVTDTWSFSVPERQVVLEVVVDFNGAYSGERPAYTLRAPDGTVTPLRDFVGNRVTVAHPMPGAWVLERVQTGATPTIEAGTLELSAVSHG